MVVGMGALLFGCGSGRGALDGRIIDHESAPVPGAIVLIKREHGVFLSEGGVACDAEALTSSDGHGHFHFKPWWPPIKIYLGRHISE